MRTLGPWPLTRWASATTWVGIVVMLVAGWWMGRYTAFWFDPDEGCAMRGQCENPSMLAVGWWVVGAGAAVVLIGIVTRWCASSPLPGPGLSRSGSGWNRIEAVALTTLGAALICSVSLFAVLVAVMLSDHAGLTVAVVMWLAQANAVAVVDRSLHDGRRSRRRGWETGLVAATLAVVATWLAAREIDVPSQSLLPMVAVWTGAVAVVVVLSWSAAPVPQRQHVP